MNKLKDFLRGSVIIIILLLIIIITSPFFLFFEIKAFIGKNKNNSWFYIIPICTFYLSSVFIKLIGYPMIIALTIWRIGFLLNLLFCIKAYTYRKSI